MSYIARLVSITKVSSVTKELMPFVHFQAEQKKVDAALMKQLTRIARLLRQP